MRRTGPWLPLRARVAALLFSIAVALGAVGTARPAEAVPISLQVDATLTSLTLGLSSSAGGATTVLSLAGVVSADIVIANNPSFGPVATGLALQGGSLAASHAALSILAAGISLSFSSTDLGASLAGPLVNTIPVAPGISVADFHSQVASLDTGSLAILGNVFADAIDFSLDLGLVPLDFVLPLNSIGQIRVGEPTPGSTLVSVSIPVDALSQLFVSGLDVDVSVSGNLVLTGTIVPEPGTGLLLGLGLLLLGTARRRASSRASSVSR